MYKNLSGQRIEGTRLTVIRRAKDYVAPNGSRHAVWLCRCDCGNEVLVRRDHMYTGNWVSCGCKRAEDAKARMREVGKRRRAKRAEKERIATPVCAQQSMECRAFLARQHVRNDGETLDGGAV